jgi:hypothetical protein
MKIRARLAFASHDRMAATVAASSASMSVVPPQSRDRFRISIGAVRLLP